MRTKTHPFNVNQKTVNISSHLYLLKYTFNVVSFMQSKIMKSQTRELLKRRKYYGQSSFSGDAILYVLTILPATSERNATNCRFIVEICHNTIFSTGINE